MEILYLKTGIWYCPFRPELSFSPDFFGFKPYYAYLCHGISEEKSKIYMFVSVIYFLPCLVSALWFFSYLLKSKNDRQKLFLWMLAVESIFYCFYAVHIFPTTDYSLLVKMDAICQPLTLVLLPMVVCYLHILGTGEKLKAIMLVLLAPALMLGCTLNLLYFLLGFEQASRILENLDKSVSTLETNSDLAQVYDIMDTDVFYIFCMLFFSMSILLSIRILYKGGYKWGDVFRFFFRNHPSTPARVIAVLYIALFICFFPITIMGRTIMIHHLYTGCTLSILLAIIKHCICHVEYYSNSSEVTFYSLSHVSNKDSVPVETVIVPSTEITEAPAAKSAAEQKVEMQGKKLRALFEEERIYLDDELTLNTVAEKLGIGKTSLSTIISLEYGMPFRDIVNHYRLEAAKEYMIKYPSATQESIAFECGFKDASSLNRKFKESEGCTPLMWLANQASVQQD